MLLIFHDHYALSLAVAHRILRQAKPKPESALCLAAGDTPRLAYHQLVEHSRQQRVDFDRCTFIALDEWLGIAPDNEGSCAFFLRSNLFSPLGINTSQIRLFDPLTPDPPQECRDMDAFILKKGGIDLMLVGVGMNGHVGFNEPGVAEGLYAHVTDLDATTGSVGQKYFKGPTDLQQGITLGLRHLLESRTALLMASGVKKAAIIARALEDPVTTEVPASIIRKHRNGVTLVDEEAATMLKNR